MLRRSSTFLLFTSTTPNLTIQPSVTSPQQARDRIKHLPTPVPLEAQFYVEGNTVSSLEDVKAAGCNQVILVAHGLLGSARNWNGTARKIGWKLPKSCAIAALDLRNHGNSPHDAVHSMDAMSADLESFAKRVEDTFSPQQLTSMGLIGHSMGGATTVNTMSMNTFDSSALPTLAKYLRASIVVDICPDCRPQDAFHNIEAAFTGMKTVDFEAHPNFTAADKQLKKTVTDSALRSFLLTNYVPQSKTEPIPRWRCNFPVLYDETMSKRLFSSTSPILHDLENQKIEIPTFFVFGADSPYNTKEGRARIPDLFDDVRQIALPGAGHYVHVQKQDEFAQLAADWFMEKMF